MKSRVARLVDVHAELRVQRGESLLQFLHLGALVGRQRETGAAVIAHREIHEPLLLGRERGPRVGDGFQHTIKILAIRDAHGPFREFDVHLVGGVAHRAVGAGFGDSLDLRRFVVHARERGVDRGKGAREGSGRGILRDDRRQRAVRLPDGRLGLGSDLVGARRINDKFEARAVLRGAGLEIGQGDGSRA